MNNKNKNFRKSPIISFIIFSVVATILLNYLMSGLTAAPEKEIYYSEFINMVKNDKVEEVRISSDKIKIYLKEEEKKKSDNPFEGISGGIFASAEPIYYTGYINDPDLKALLEEHNVKFTKPVVEQNYLMDILLTWVLPFAMIALF